ncbi:hypothetical protein AUR04nite_06820 [Glutamicibacter uratoxydans]|uniref:Excalibur calcium-binding domain-containing protein n=1 Tax=Glutamicibacter uratoxydans TaxID=43667 RepID=A0A4Y4DNG0_GLUUR|nr:excalibur calcium-binding domain-containing protein [Glutamicibacter uratoxydans]GED05150.1 hypothetical protein AUR04nite_06820 [Glutamicibacter uratoxydans]
MPIFRSQSPSLRTASPQRVAAGLGIAIALLFSSGCAAATQADEPESSSTDLAASSTASPSGMPSESPTEIASFLGQECDSDELVMEQGDQQLFCDADASGALLWTTQDEHVAALALAQKKADDEKAAKKAAAEKAAADKKIAAEKAAAEKKAAQKLEAEKKAAREAAAKAEAKQKAAAKKAAQKTAAPKAKKAPTNTFYKNCTAVRAAGAAPIYAGDAGYSRKLDRDGDGVACE